MTKANTLSGLNVIITRPLHQAEGLTKLIVAKGGNPVLLPALEIKFLPPTSIPNVSLYPDQIDLAIFTSQNAVRGATALLPKPLTCKVAAIGPSTARALQTHNITVDMMPAEQYDSEHLLALPFFEHVENKNIVIFAGKGGRTWLQEQLQLRGAKVLKVALYQRACPTVAASSVDHITALNQRIIIATSGEVLENLCTIFRGHGKEAWLLASPLLLVSQRLTKIAQSLDFKENLLVQAHGAADLAILEYLIKWYARQRHGLQK